MTRKSREIADRLVDLSDGELSAQEAAGVRVLVDRSGELRETLRALDRSLEHARTIWCDVEAEQPSAVSRQPAAAGSGGAARPSSAMQRAGVRSLRPGRGVRVTAALAASFALVLVGTWWIDPPRSDVQPDRPEAAGSVDVRQIVMRAGVSAELLAAGEILAQQPGGEVYARERFAYVAREYADTPAGVEARRRLEALNTRRSMQ